ncbi:hypothetical protein [Streptomyces gardneri]|uniref:hypothetical protein n=1 Tax=Streptomyces gardneri TaxID=66892 RepID=UPI0035DB5ECF
MTEQTDPDRRRHAIAFNALGTAIKASGKWMPFTARQAAVDAVLDAIDADARDADRQTIGQTDTKPDPAIVEQFVHHMATQPPTQPTSCICGHQEQQHIEDVCQDCGCGDYLEPADAHDVIKRWRDAALEARAQLAAVGQPAEAHDTDEARPPRSTWRVEGYDADEWNAVSCTFQRSEDAHARKRVSQRYPDMPTRVVHEKTTWTVENPR